MFRRLVPFDSNAIFNVLIPGVPTANSPNLIQSPAKAGRRPNRILNLFRLVWLARAWRRLIWTIKPSSRLNGTRRHVTFAEVFSKYRELHLPTVTLLTRIKFEDRAHRFFGPILSERIAGFNPERIAGFIRAQVKAYRPSKYAKRYNFHREIRDLRSILNWWKQHFDFQYENPVCAFHLNLGVLEPLPVRDHKISPEETLRFMSHLAPLYRDIATFAFFAAGRVGEIAGIQVKNLDLERNVLVIQEVLTWIRGRPVLKGTPKNGEARETFLNETMREIIRRRLPLIPPGCPFLFHDEKGKPLRYSRIADAYNRAWKKAGLSDRLSSTHALRYAGAKTARLVTGSLEATAAVTGHKTMAMAEMYGRMPSLTLNQSSVLAMEKHMNSLSEEKAKKGEPSPGAAEPKRGSAEPVPTPPRVRGRLKGNRINPEGGELTPSARVLATPVFPPRFVHNSAV